MKHYRLPDGYSFFESFGRTYQQVKDPIGAMEESMKRFGGTYFVNLGFRKMIATQDPRFIDHVLKTNHRNYHKSVLTARLGKFIGNGLLTSNGEYWLRQRRLIQPGFHADKIQALFEIMRRTVEHFIAGFPTGDRIDVYPLMNSLAFEMVINTLFNVEVPVETRNELSQFITETQEFVIRDIRQPQKSWWFVLSGEVRAHFAKAERARAIIRSIIRSRQNSEQRFGDLLDMLLDARYEDTGSAMEESQVIDEILILLIAGHETTANTLSWTLFLLSRHPRVAAILRETTRDLDIAGVVKHEWLNAVVNESMRLFPPAWISDRVALHDDAYDRFTFPRGTIILLFYYGLHRDPAHWENPEQFVPERFLKAWAAKDKLKAYYPFGGGPRLCIGNNFAMAEMTLFLQAMVQSFEILARAEEPRRKPLITLRPDRVVLEVKRR